jgi:hypothetical protein
MQSLNTRPEVVTAVADFINALSLLIVSLIGLMRLSAGMIVLAVMRHSLVKKARPAVAAVPSRSQEGSLTLFPQISIAQLCIRQQMK